VPLEPYEFSWWTQVVVPLGAALIGGAGALLGAWLGARWAANEQRRHADEIAAERQRQDRQSRALQELDEVLVQLERQALSMEETWAIEPYQFASNWSTELRQHLAAVRSERLAVGPRLSTPGIRDALEGFDIDRLEAEIQAAHEEVNRHQQATIDELRAAIEDGRTVNSRLLAEVRALRASVNRAI
jgi:hypothetical protein